MDCIPTCDSLAKQNVPLLTISCEFYNAEEEMVNNIYTSCSLSVWEWIRVSAWCRINPVYVFSFKDLLDIPYLL